MGATGSVGLTGPTGSQNDAPTLYMTESSGTLLKSIDDGLTWSSEFISPGSGPIKHFASNGTILLAISNAQQLHQSFDFGRSWSNSSSFNETLNCVVYNGSNFLLGTEENLHTSMDGLSWTVITQTNFTSIKSVLWTNSKWIVYGFFAETPKLCIYTNATFYDTVESPYLPSPVTPKSLAKRIVNLPDGPDSSNTEEVLLVGTNNGSKCAAVYYSRYSVGPSGSGPMSDGIQDAIEYLDLEGVGYSVSANDGQVILSGNFTDGPFYFLTNEIYSNSIAGISSYSVQEIPVSEQVMGKDIIWTGTHWVFNSTSLQMDSQTLELQTYVHVSEFINEPKVPSMSTVYSSASEDDFKGIWTPNTWTYRPSLGDQIAALQL